MFQKQRKGFVSWSGGKDSALACYNAVKNDKVKVAYLLNMLSESGIHSRSHHLNVAALKAQAEAMGIPIIQRRAAWGGYEEEFKKALAVFKKEGIQTGVFGDIDVEEHRDWVERVCSESGLNAVLPLWQRSRESLMGEFIAVGFKAVIVTVKLECMGAEWLGRQLDRQFVEDMKRLPQVDPVRDRLPKAAVGHPRCPVSNGVDLCGENGEYHTFVYDGPVFKTPVIFSAGEKMHTQTHSFLDIVCKQR